MAAFFFSSPVDIDIKLEGEDLRKQVESKAEKDRPISCPVYFDGESVSGQVRRFLRPCPLPAISTVLRPNAGHGSCSGGKAHNARGNQSRVYGKHRHVYVPSACFCPLIRSLLQSYSTTVVTTKNSFHSRKSSLPPESCDRRRRSTFYSRMLRSSTRAT